MGWLNLQATTPYGGLELDIPTGTVLTVPFPLQKSLEDYEKAVIRYRNTSGI